MANEEHQAILRQGAQVWNQWRAQHPKIQPDLSQADLRGADLSEADLSGANLSGANLYGANLSRADLFLSNLTRANLSEANLHQADLTEADLYEATLYEANLSDANLSRAGLYGASLHGANLDRSAPGSGAVAFKTALIFGPSMAVLDGMVGAFFWGLRQIVPGSDTTLTETILPILLLLSFLIMHLLSYFLMGIVAPARTGKIRAGVFTSLWTNGWLGILSLIVISIITYLADRQAGLPPDNLWRELGLGVILVFILTVFFDGLGAGVSALSGLLGRTLYKKRKVLL